MSELFICFLGLLKFCCESRLLLYGDVTCTLLMLLLLLPLFLCGVFLNSFFFFGDLSDVVTLSKLSTLPSRPEFFALFS